MSFMSTIKKILTITVILVLLIGSVAVSSLNADSVELNLYWYQFSLPLGFMLMLFAAMGLLIGMVLAGLFWLWPANRRKIYWQREYFKLKQLQDDQVSAIKDAGSIELALDDDKVQDQPAVKIP